MKILFLFAVVITSAVGARADVLTKFDEFGILACEELQARTENLGRVISDDPTATAIVVLYRGADKPSHVDWYRRAISKMFRRYGYDSTRLRFFRGEDSAQTRAVLWLAPAGVDLRLYPDLDTPWLDPVAAPPDLTKPFLFGTESELGICEMFVPADFADVIKTNAQTIGRIIVHPEANLSLASVIGDHWIKIFVDQYGIPRKRLKLIYGKPNKFSGYTELWIAPARGAKFHRGI